MGLQVFRIFYENLFKEIRIYGMFLSSIIVFGTFLRERSPHLKRELNIALFPLINIIRMVSFTYFILFSSCI
jgi:hypothetical protein